MHDGGCANAGAGRGTASLYDLSSEKAVEPVIKPVTKQGRCSAARIHHTSHLASPGSLHDIGWDYVCACVKLCLYSTKIVLTECDIRAKQSQAEAEPSQAKPKIKSSKSAKNGINPTLVKNVFCGSGTQTCLRHGTEPNATVYCKISTQEPDTAHETEMKTSLLSATPLRILSQRFIIIVPDFSHYFKKLAGVATRAT